MGYKQVRVCDCCDKEIETNTAYHISKVILETDSYTDAAGDLDYSQIKLEFCPICVRFLIKSLEKINANN